MKRLLQLGSVLLLGVVVLVSQAGRTPTPDEAARAAAIKLWKSLTDDQKKLALRDLNDKERYQEVFPPNERPGLPFTKLTADQKSLVDDVVRAMTSEYGAKNCLEVGKQAQANRRYLTFYAEPSADKPFAWRIAQHHLTLIYAEFGKDKANEFGPILLGGNPVNKMWDEEEKIVLDLYVALSPDEVKSISKGKGSSTSGSPIGDSGIRIGDLGEKAKGLAHKLLEKRLAVFSKDRRKVLEGIIKGDGGVDKMRLAIWGEATKSHHDGGKYHWRIGSASVVCDWQTQGANHIHMTVRGRKS
jgi:hypothetical protein